MTDDSHQPLLAAPDSAFGGDAADGRTMRRRRNRDAVIEALIELIREGDLAPTVDRIADRAAVSHRSIFRYFDDLNDLARAAIDTELRRGVLMGALADPGKGSLDDRIEAIVTKHLAILAQTHMLGRVARARMIAIPEVERGLALVNEYRLGQLRQHFAPELDAMDEDCQEAILTALLMTVGFESYDIQLRNLDLTPDEIAENWRITLRALLS